MFGLFGGGAPEPRKDPIVSPEELSEIHRKWAELQDGHRHGLEGLLSKLVDENAAVKAKLAQTEQELKMWKAGSKEDQKELKQLRTELKGLRGGDIVSSTTVPALQRRLLTSQLRRMVRRRSSRLLSPHSFSESQAELSRS